LLFERRPVEGTGTSVALLGLKVERLERDVEDLQKNSATAATVTALRSEMDDLRDDMKSLRNALYAFALGVPGAAIIAVGGYLLGGPHH
jgi:hypothetical protein